MRADADRHFVRKSHENPKVRVFSWQQLLYTFSRSSFVVSMCWKTDGILVKCGRGATKVAVFAG